MIGGSLYDPNFFHYFIHQGKCDWTDFSFQRFSPGLWCCFLWYDLSTSRTHFLATPALIAHVYRSCTCHILLLHDNVFCFFVGFPNKKHCSLVNTSLIPMTFTLKVPADEIEEINYEEETESDSEAQNYKQREFEITPFSATLSPQSTQDIQVSQLQCKYNANIHETLGDI